jgi:hypothetical protein
MDPEDRRSLIARSEVERRQRYIHQLENKFPTGKQHPLVLLMKRCLQNDPSERPTSEEVVASLKEMKAGIEGPYGEIARADAVRQVVMMRALKRRETEVSEKSDESAAKDEEIQQLQQELEHEQVVIIRLCVCVCVCVCVCTCVCVCVCVCDVRVGGGSDLKYFQCEYAMVHLT